MPDAAPSRVGGYVCLVGALLIWSAWALGTRWGLTESPYGPWELGQIRFLFAAAVMGPVLWKIGLWSKERGPIPWRVVALLSLAVGPGYVGFSYSGVRLAPASHGAALTAGMLPFVATLMAARLRLVQLNRFALTGLALIAVAAGMFFADGLTGVRTDALAEVWRGDVLLLCAVLCYATYTVTLKVHHIDAVRAAAITSLAGLLLFTPLFLVNGSVEVLIQSGWRPFVTQGAFHGLLVVAVSLTLFSHAVWVLGPTAATLGSATVPGLTAVVGSFLLHEPLTAWIIAGVIMDALGITMVALATAARTTPSAD